MKRLAPAEVALVLAATVVAATAMAAPARAADLPVAPTPGYYPPTMPPALYNWNGIYVGGQVGAGLLSDSVSQVTPATLSGTASIGPAGVVGGGQAGFNLQFAPLVVGAEAAWSATNLTGTGSAFNPTAVGTERYTSAPLWFASATGRVGYAANDWLFYAKGGGAWMQVSYTDDFLVAGVTNASQAINDKRKGYTAGVGVEYGLTENISARLEYDFYDFGTKTYNFANAAGTLAPGSIRSDLNTVTFGLNYRFTWAGGGPLVGR